MVNLEIPETVIGEIQIGEIPYLKFKCNYCGKVTLRKMSVLRDKSYRHLFCTSKCSGRFNSQTRRLNKQLCGVHV